MARIRTIKPEFFTSPDIVDRSPMARLFYIALWCEADREGRFVWSIRSFRLRYFAGDPDVDVEALAKELIDAGLVVLYDGGKLAHIPTFATHQHVNPREAASKLPAPPESASNERVIDASLTRREERKEGKEGEGKESNLAAAAACPLDPMGQADPEPPSTGKKPQKPSSPFPDCPHNRLLALWQKRLPHLQQPRVWEGNRKATMRQRWQQAAKPSPYSPQGYRTEAEGVAWWDSFFAYIATDTKLAEGFDSKGRTWQPDLEWVCNAANFQKIIDGKYAK